MKLANGEFHQMVILAIFRAGQVPRMAASYRNGPLRVPRGAGREGAVWFLFDRGTNLCDFGQTFVFFTKFIKIHTK